MKIHAMKDINAIQAQQHSSDEPATYTHGVRFALLVLISILLYRQMVITHFTIAV